VDITMPATPRFRRGHLAGAVGDGAVGHDHLELAARGVVDREPAQVRAHQLARAAHDGPEQAREVEAARQVLRGFDHREHAAFALLVKLEPVAQRHGHAHQLHQAGLALQRIGQRLDMREAGGELFGGCVPVQQADELGCDLVGLSGPATGRVRFRSWGGAGIGREG
jgi:hypothetical protein